MATEPDKSVTEFLGALVRDEWIAWAKEQPDITEHPHWLTEWEKLSERDREVDRRIGMRVAQFVLDRALRKVRFNTERTLNRLLEGDVE